MGLILSERRLKLPEDSLRVADPESHPPALLRIALPHFAER